MCMVKRTIEQNICSFHSSKAPLYRRFLINFIYIYTSYCGGFNRLPSLCMSSNIIMIVQWPRQPLYIHQKYRWFRNPILPLKVYFPSTQKFYGLFAAKNCAELKFADFQGCRLLCPHALVPPCFPTCSSTWHSLLGFTSALGNYACSRLIWFSLRRFSIPWMCDGIFIYLFAVCIDGSIGGYQYLELHNSNAVSDLH